MLTSGSTQINNNTNNPQSDTQDQQPENGASTPPARHYINTNKYKSQHKHSINHNTQYNNSNDKYHRHDLGNSNRRTYNHSSYTSSTATSLNHSTQQSANHLLNFKYNRPEDVLPQRRYKKPVQYHKYNKAAYLSANYQFVLSDTVLGKQSYYTSLSDSDYIVQWSSVVLVLYNNTINENIQCPICLSDPQVPIVTNCGHIFCSTCIYHYISLNNTNTTFTRCPTCFSLSINLASIKPVVINTSIKPAAGDAIEMRLMQRYKACTIATPYYPNSKPITYIAPIKSLSDIPQYATYRTLLTDNNQWIYSMQLDKLTQQMDTVDTNDKETLFYIQMAVSDLLQYIDSDNNIPTTVQQVSQRNASKSTLDTHEHVVNAMNRSSSTNDNSTSTTDDDIYYYYQAANGLHIYINSLNSRMLWYDVNNNATELPPLITANVLSLQHNIQTRHTKDRLRFIRHLPITSLFTIVTLDLSNIVSHNTLQHFSVELSSEAKQRRRYAAEQKKLDQLAAEQHIYIAPPTYNCTVDDNELLQIINDNDNLPPIITSPPINSVSAPPMHFSIIAKHGFAASSEWAALEDLHIHDKNHRPTSRNNNNNVVQTNKTAWGTTVPAIQHTNTPNTADDAELARSSANVTPTVKKKKKSTKWKAFG